MDLDITRAVSYVLALGPAAGAGYLGLLTALSWRRTPKPLAPGAQLPRFVVVVPAHNEAAQIAATVTSLRAMDYGQDRFVVAVVADNCTDATATLAASAGAQVLSRSHATDRGKGYALDFAFKHYLGQTDAAVDAFCVVDADSIVSPNLLTAFAQRLGAGEQAMQAYYGVRNPWASWRTRLMAVALAMIHRVRGLGRERLRLSAGLRGNGMGFSAACLRAHPHDAHGLVEDVEYGITLGLGGIRIAYVDEAQVLGEMVSGAQGSESQRQRWEGGRKQLVRERLPVLLAEAFRRRSGLLLDLALDLAVPPLGTLGALLALGWVYEALRHLYGGTGADGATAVWAWGTLSLVAYVLRGVVGSGLGFGAVTALMWAPIYLVWKLMLKLAPKRQEGWVRTAREAQLEVLHDSAEAKNAAAAARAKTEPHNNDSTTH